MGAKDEGLKLPHGLCRLSCHTIPIINFTLKVGCHHLPNSVSWLAASVGIVQMTWHSLYPPQLRVVLLLVDITYTYNPVSNLLIVEIHLIN